MQEELQVHYEKIWNQQTGRKLTWTSGAFIELPPKFCVLEFHPNHLRQMWTYATCGMSLQGDAPPLELHLFSPVQDLQHVELLTAIAHYHVTGEYLECGHTVYFGRSWLPDSCCDYGLISLPYLDGPELEWLEGSHRTTRFLWLIPITKAEKEFKRQKGLEALEERFQSTSFNYLDPKRRSVV